MEPEQRSRLMGELGHLRREVADLERRLALDRPSTPPPEAPEPLGLAAYRLVADRGVDMISIHSAGGEYLWASPASEALTGWKPEELVGRNAYELFHPDDVSRIAEDHAAHGEGYRGSVRYRIRCKDGSYRWVDTRSSAFGNEGGVQQIVASTRDVSDETRTELSRMTATLVAALAHEINNPLGIVFMALHALERGNERALVELKEAIYRIADTVRGVSILIADQSGDTRVVDAREVIERAVSSFVYEPVDIDVDCDDLTFATDRVRFSQLVHTLLLVYLHAGGEEPIAVSCHATDDRVRLRFEGSVPETPTALHIDMGAVLRGERAPPSVPLLIAERLAADLDATWIAERDGMRLAIEVALPDGQSGRPTRS